LIQIIDYYRNLSKKIILKLSLFGLVFFLVLIISFSNNVAGKLNHDNQILGNNSYSRTFNGICIDEEIIYVTDSYREMLVYDISHNHYPKIIDEISFSQYLFYDIGSVLNTHICNDMLFVCGSEGFEVFDISIPQIPEHLKIYFDYSGVYDICIQDDFAYICQGTEDVAIIDISNPLICSKLGSFDNIGREYRLDVLNDFVFVADMLQGLEIIDVSNHSSPFLAHCINATSAFIPRDVMIVNNLAYVAAGRRNLVIFEISDPLSPTIVSEFTSSNFYAYDIRVQGDFVYLFDVNKGVEILDCSNLLQPKLVATITGDFAEYDVDGNYLGLLDEYKNELIIYNIVDPSNPKKVINLLPLTIALPVTIFSVIVLSLLSIFVIKRVYGNKYQFTEILEIWKKNVSAPSIFKQRVINDELDISELVKALNDSDWRIRKFALQGLAKKEIIDEETISTISERLTDKRRAVARVALDIIQKQVTTSTISTELSSKLSDDLQDINFTEKSLIAKRIKLASIILGIYSILSPLLIFGAFVIVFSLDSAFIFILSIVLGISSLIAGIILSSIAAKRKLGYIGLILNLIALAAVIGFLVWLFTLELVLYSPLLVKSIIIMI